MRSASSVASEFDPVIVGTTKLNTSIVMTVANKPSASASILFLVKPYIAFDTAKTALEISELGT